MKLAIVIAGVLACGTPVYAQFGGINGALGKLQKAQDAKKKIDDLTFTDAEEQTIGASVSEKIRARFGVVQDRAVHTYVTLVGRTVTETTDRPALDWTFIVLDTDGVNAFASPGGFVHITRGALGLIQNEAELAGVLAHEIGHVTRRHTINAIRKSNAEKLLAETASNRGVLLTRFADLAYGQILEGAFDRGDEIDADKASTEFTQKAGYAPLLADFLTRLDDRNKDQPARNGLFASHPETKERVDKIRQLAGSARTTAKGQVRYKASVPYEPTPLTAIAAVPDGSSGLTGGGKDDTANAKKEEESKKKGFGLRGLKQTVAPEKQSAQVSASGGARGVGPDRAAKGGSNPALVKITVSQAEVDEFRKGVV